MTYLIYIYKFIIHYLFLNTLLSAQIINKITVLYILSYMKIINVNKKHKIESISLVYPYINPAYS